MDDCFVFEVDGICLGRQVTTGSFIQADKFKPVSLQTD